jgi:hypothetical protein
MTSHFGQYPHDAAHDAVIVVFQQLNQWRDGVPVINGPYASVGLHKLL